MSMRSADEDELFEARDEIKRLESALAVAEANTVHFGRMSEKIEKQRRRINALEADLAAERERNAKLERVLDAAWDIAKGRCTTFGYHFKGGDGETLDRAISEARRP